MPTTIPDLDHFDHDSAWRVGSDLVAVARAQQAAVTIGLWIGDQRVFHAALPGTSADNGRWVERKARIAQHFGLPSADVHDRYVGGDVEAFLRIFALPIDQYFPAGGAVPIVVRGTVIGVLAVSGLASDEDHQLAVDALRREGSARPEQ